MAAARRSGASRRKKPQRAALCRRRTIPKLPVRKRDAHKGSFGRVLVIGGSRGMIGAPALAANAALRGGAGLVAVACPKAIQPFVATLCPCATSIPLPEQGAGLIHPKTTIAELRRLGLLRQSGAPSVVAFGPGLGQGGAVFSRGCIELIRAFGGAGVPVVLDADALNALATVFTKRSGRGSPVSLSRVVITPHPGEMARLHNVSPAAVQRDRECVAVRTAAALTPASGDAVDRAVVVLKGADTVVTDGRLLHVNRTGNPGMATGGSGDVLTGVIAALIGQGLSTFDASVLGVHVHGRAGDLAASSLGQVSLTASDLIDYLPSAFQGGGTA